VGGSDEFRKKVHAEQKRVYDEVDAWICENGLEYSEEGWRAEAYLYCVEMAVPEWDGWHIPICPSWVIAPKNRTWMELVPIVADKRFGFRVVHGGDGWSHAEKGTKQVQNVVCPQSLWELFKRDGRHLNTPHTIPYNQLIENAGGLRRWEKHEFIPRPDDLLQERLYCIRWRLPDLKKLLIEEQALRSTQKHDSRLQVIAVLFSGLRTFFTDQDWITLGELRQHDWAREMDKITALESEIALVREQKGPAEALKLLRTELKERKDARHERETALSHLSVLVPRLVYREPNIYDLEVESKVVEILNGVFEDWQGAGWIPGWRIEPGAKTNELIRTRGWTYWSHLFTPRQLLVAGEYSQRMSACESRIRLALTICMSRMLDYNNRLCRWLGTDGGGIGGAKQVFYNQALNTLSNYANRGWSSLKVQLLPTHIQVHTLNNYKKVTLSDARDVSDNCVLWITDPPYADAVNYEELSEFFLAWYVPHLKAAFPDWYTDSMRSRAVKGNDAPFRVSMADCYRRLAEKMPDDGMQVLMFTHKSTDVWEDLALIMWAAGLQVKQVWSVATETPGAGIRTGNFVQATYNMVLRKRTGSKMGFVDFITPQVNRRVQ
jgi:adenine-specific DNA methylase